MKAQHTWILILSCKKQLPIPKNVRKGVNVLMKMIDILRKNRDNVELISIDDVDSFITDEWKTVFKEKIQSKRIQNVIDIWKKYSEKELKNTISQWK